MKGTDDHRRPGLVRALLPGAAILVLLGSLYSYHREATRLGERARSLQEEAEASALRERLLGARLSGLEFEVLHESDPEHRAGPQAVHVMWLVNPRTCLGCLEDLSEWRSLGRRPAVATSLVLTGLPRIQALRVRRNAVADGGTVLWDPGGSVMTSLTRDETPPPFLLLVLGSEGRVVSAEVGHGRIGCSPTLLENVSRLVAMLAEPREGDRTDDRSPVWTTSASDR